MLCSSQARVCALYASIFYSTIQEYDRIWPRWFAMQSEDFLHTSKFRLNILHFVSHTSYHIKQLIVRNKLWHREIFTHRTFYIRKLLYTEAFTQRSFYTEKLLHTANFCIKKLLHREALAHRSFCTQKFFHAEAFTQTSFYTQQAFA